MQRHLFINQLKTSEVKALKGFNKSVLMVANAIADHLPYAFPSYEKIMQDTCIRGRTTVSKAIKFLTDYKFITITKLKGNKNKYNMHIINVKALKEQSSSAKSSPLTGLHEKNLTDFDSPVLGESSPLTGLEQSTHWTVSINEVSKEVSNEEGEGILKLASITPASEHATPQIKTGLLETGLLETAKYTAEKKYKHAYTPPQNLEAKNLYDRYFFAREERKASQPVKKSEFATFGGLLETAKAEIQKTQEIIEPLEALEPIKQEIKEIEYIDEPPIKNEVQAMNINHNHNQNTDSQAVLAVLANLTESLNNFKFEVADKLKNKPKEQEYEKAENKELAELKQFIAKLGVKQNELIDKIASMEDRLIEMHSLLDKKMKQLTNLAPALQSRPNSQNIQEYKPKFTDEQIDAFIPKSSTIDKLKQAFNIDNEKAQLMITAYKAYVANQVKSPDCKINDLNCYLERAITEKWQFLTNAIASINASNNPVNPFASNVNPKNGMPNYTQARSPEIEEFRQGKSHDEFMRSILGDEYTPHVASGLMAISNTVKRITA
jgi:hypothetical protein